MTLALASCICWDLFNSNTNMVQSCNHKDRGKISRSDHVRACIINTLIRITNPFPPNVYPVTVCLQTGALFYALLTQTILEKLISRAVYSSIHRELDTLVCAGGGDAGEAPEEGAGLEQGSSN